MKIGILGFEQAYAGLLTGLMDIFNHAGKVEESDVCHIGNKSIEVELISVDGKPIRCQNNLLLDVHCGIEHMTRPDIFLITAIHDIDNVLSSHVFMIDWLRKQYEQGTALASICTGAFLLAETGLLDGKKATTHWSMAESFKKRYPQVRLNSSELVINNGNLYCSGGAGASTDLAYFLLEKFIGHSSATGIAKYFLHDFRRVSQHMYEIYTPKTEHNDLEIKQVQHWIEKHLDEPISPGFLAAYICMSTRTFERRFKKATGDNPTVYIQRLKVEAAKALLETTNLSFEQIANQMGYENSGSFRKIFMRWVGLRPLEYRNRFLAYG